MNRFEQMKLLHCKVLSSCSETLEDENLANNLLVHIEGGILENYSHEDVVADFRSKGDRRVDL